VPSPIPRSLNFNPLQAHAIALSTFFITSPASQSRNAAGAFSILSKSTPHSDTILLQLKLSDQISTTAFQLKAFDAPGTFSKSTLFQSDPLVSAFEISLIAFSKFSSALLLRSFNIFAKSTYSREYVFLFHWLALNNINKDLLQPSVGTTLISFKPSFGRLIVSPSFPQNFLYSFQSTSFNSIVWISVSPS
jgi:hypothetical protein